MFFVLIIASRSDLVYIRNRLIKKILKRSVRMENDIIIVGAGPAGLWTAIELADLGYRPMVIEMKKSMDHLNRACSMQLIIDDDYENDILRVKDGKLIFEKNDFYVPYTGRLVPVYNKFYHSPSNHVIRFTRDEGREPFSYKFDKQQMLKDLYNICVEKGVRFMMGTLVMGGKDSGDKVEVNIKHDKEKKTLTCKKLIIAEGVNSVICGKFGLNKDREASTTAYCLKYVMDGITGVEENSWNLYYGSVYYSGTAPIIGPSLEGYGIYEVTITGSQERMPQKIFEDFTTKSPMAKNFRNAKVLKRVGCSVKSFMGMKEPCKGNVIAIGDTAAMIEVETQGAFLCGQKAAKAIDEEFKGQNGFEGYTKWWRESFEFNGEDYLQVSHGYALAFIYNDEELDYLFSLVEGHDLHGTYSQYLTPKLIWDEIHRNDDRIRNERPDIYEKMKENGQA